MQNYSSITGSAYMVGYLNSTEVSLYSTAKWIVAIVCILILSVARNRNRSPISNIPMCSRNSICDFGARKAKDHWMVNCRDIIIEGFQQFGKTSPFRVIMDLGEMLIIPPSMADEIRNVEEFSHADFMVESTCANIPGFEPYLISTASDLLNILTKTKLVSHLKLMTQPMSDCVASACPSIFSEDIEWHETNLKGSLLHLIASLSATIFLGDEPVGTDPKWINLTKDYTVSSFIASHQLRVYPRFLWPLVAKILPSTRKVHQQFKDTEALINPIVQKRRKAKAQGQLEKLDAVEWAEQVAQEHGITYSPAAAQLNMALSAIHTTTDLITTTMYELLKCPGAVDLLRREIISVISDSGLRHSHLSELKIMDSAIKEAQRLKPVLSVNMVRKACRTVTLPSGLRIPAGTRLGVPANASWDASIFPNPQRFDPERFVRLRETDNHWQLTSLRSEQIAFGLGKHACPGRFLAANEIKIALCHLLIKYDWEMSELPHAMSNGIFLDSDPGVKVKVRRRKAEIVL